MCKQRCHCESVELRGMGIPFKCQNTSRRSAKPPLCKGGQKAPLADQGELSRASPASTRLRGSELPSFRAFSTVAPLQSLSHGLAGDGHDSSLYTREPLGAPAPVRLSMFLRRTGKLHHIHNSTRRETARFFVLLFPGRYAILIA